MLYVLPSANSYTARFSGTPEAVQCSDSKNITYLGLEFGI